MADQDRFARALLAVARGLGRIARERARAGDVTPQQAETLQLIAERGALSTSTLATLLGIDPSIVLEGANQMQQQRPAEQAAPRDPNKPKDEGQVFVEKVLGSTEDVWNQILPQQINRQYKEPGLVLFSNAVRSACGN